MGDVLDLSIDYATLHGAPGDASGVHAFLGIPYAEPPIGERRWTAPVPIGRKLGLIDATRHGPVPAQPHQPHQRAIAHKLFFSPSAPQSEDCLYLNVWTPTLDTAARRPVMMWIPGGGFRGGSAASPLYDGAQLARLGVVLVSINYRVSRFGFLAHSWLSRESSDGASGNYGLLDQIAALTWIRDHIERFGGDPANVTIFGQSAGAQSVCFLMTSPLAKGLFHRAIAQSGSPFASARHAGVVGRRIQTREDAEAEGQSVVERLGIGSLRALRACSTQAILQACPPESFTASRPIVDGHVLPHAPAEAYEQSAFNDVPLICGTARNEGSIFDSQWAQEEHRAFCRKHMPDHEGDYFALYPASDDDTSRRSATRAYGDRMYRWPVEAWARAHAGKASSPTYLYRFCLSPPVPAQEGADCTVAPDAFHGSELAYVFGNFYPHDWSWTDADRDTSATLARLWTQFAAAGTPDGDDTPAWTRFDPSAPQNLTIGPHTFAMMDTTSSRLAFWQRFAS